MKGSGHRQDDAGSRVHPGCDSGRGSRKGGGREGGNGHVALLLARQCLPSVRCRDGGLVSVRWGGRDEGREGERVSGRLGAFSRPRHPLKLNVPFYSFSYVPFLASVHHMDLYRLSTETHDLKILGIPAVLVEGIMHRIEGGDGRVGEECFGFGTMCDMLAFLWMVAQATDHPSSSTKKSLNRSFSSLLFPVTVSSSGIYRSLPH